MEPARVRGGVAWLFGKTLAWLFGGLLSLAVVIGLGVLVYVTYFAEFDLYVPLFAEHCSSCHGAELTGTGNGPALVARTLDHGDEVAELIESIKHRHPSLGTPAFAADLSPLQIKGLAIYVGERRLGQHFTEFRYDTELAVSDAVHHSEAHDFVLETVVDGLDPMVFSIEPLPNETFLLTEKERGLSIVANGQQSPLIGGTPEMGGSINIMGINYGTGWLLDVKAHPDYAYTRLGLSALHGCVRRALRWRGVRRHHEPVGSGPHRGR